MHGTSSTSSIRKGWATRTKWHSARRLCTGSRIHRSASPAWMLDHDARSHEMIARVFDGQVRRAHPRRHSRQHHALLADEHGNLFGASVLGHSTARSRLLRRQGRHDPGRRERFSDEIYTAPRSWTEKAYPKLIHYNKLPKGGHFAAWEQPQFYSRGTSHGALGRCANRSEDIGARTCARHLPYGSVHVRADTERNRRG